jgi:hypothetical protein
MLFSILFLVGIVIPFLFLKSKTKCLKWIPAICSLIFTVLIGLKILFYPAPEMAVLGEIVYFMLLGSAFIGTLIGGMIIHYLKMEKS